MRNENEQGLGDVLKGWVDELKLKEKLYQHKVQEAWKVLMGTTISNYTSEIKLRKGTLLISIDSAPLRQELSYSKEKIMKMLNEELGEDYIQAVKIR